MTILVTGAAGFIGSAVVQRLLNSGEVVVGYDNHNDYYDPKLKENRIAHQISNKNYTHIRGDTTDKVNLSRIFGIYHPRIVINLAAQAGVGYSIKNPTAYIESNLVGFLNILELSRLYEVKHLVYASSSSVYGGNRKMPFSESDSTNHPLSFYAATKKANELMAHTYSHVYGLPTTGLRFFTVYGPWDRPDMALQKFTTAIINDEVIKLNNYGNHMRDFTYIDDVVDGITRIMDLAPTQNSDWDSNAPSALFSNAPWRIFNIGSGKPITLSRYIEIIETYIGKSAKKDLLPLQAGDVLDTFSDISLINNKIGFRPKISIEEGVKNFIDWYLMYYKK